MFERVFDRLVGVRPQAWGWSARCPAHDDQRSSLTVRISEKGDLLLKCHRGCQFEEIVASLGLKREDCWREREERPQLSREVAHYDYRDEQGILLYQTVRFEPKDFRQRIPDGSGWKWGLHGMRRVLYRLPELTAEPSRLVLVVEGEKDVDRLIQIGFLATTNPMGAKKWHESYNAALSGRIVIIIPDSDPPGLEHAQQVAASLQAVAKRVVTLPLAEGKDATAWLELGHTAEELKELIRQALACGVRDVWETARKLPRADKWSLLRQLVADLEIAK